MEIADVRIFLADNHRGVLVARKKDGSPQITLVSPCLGPDGRPLVTARESTYKVKNIRRDPRVSLLVMGEQFHGSKYIQIDGTAEIIPHPRAMDLVLHWHRQVKGEHPNWDEYGREVLKEGRLAIRIDIEKVGPQRKR